MSTKQPRIDQSGTRHSAGGQNAIVWLTILRLAGVAIALAGLVLLGGGGYLTLLGGSPYYLLCGVAATASGVLLVLRRREGALLYGFAFLATLAWAIWEAGYDGWTLMPRLVAPALAGVVLLLPGVLRLLGGRLPISRGRALAIIVALLVAGPLLRALVPPPSSPDPLYQTGTTVASVPADNGPANDGLHTNNALAGTNFSSLTQITPANVAGLEPAWSVHFGVMPGGMEAAPIKIGKTLYTCTSVNDVLALDAATGKELWRFEAHLSEMDRKSLGLFACRGVSYYHVPDRTGPCAERILTNTLDARLIALDAQNGRPCAEFGANGTVSLMTGMGDFPHGYYHATSAPAVALGKIIVGGYIPGDQTRTSPSGVIRAFDAVTGKLVWAWDMGHPERTGEPPPGETYTTGTPNAWAPMSVDETLGLVYAPLGSSSPDFFGGDRRPFDDTYGSTLVALDIATGRPRWWFQTTHHDLWDYDVPARPTLVDYTTADGRLVHAAIQGTKRGELFVLDRATGLPLSKVEERPVPQAGVVPEERLSPTQPFSVGMPSLRGADLHETNMWGLSPIDQLWCRVKFREARYEGVVTPPGLTPSIQYPGLLGGVNWGGLAYDPSRGIVIVNTSMFPFYIQLVTRAAADALGMKPFDDSDEHNKVVADFGHSAQAGTPYAVFADPFVSPLQVPCIQPPYGRLSAIDLKTGKLIWTRILGTAQDSGPLGTRSRLPIPLGTLNLGGAVTTQSGLTFIGATADKYLRAYDTATGKQLWRARLPSSAQATPMTYVEDGRQYVVIAAGGHMAFPGSRDVHLLAYALPRK